jgi:hypothetical protein
VRDATLKEWSETSAGAFEEQFERAMSNRSGSFAEREAAAMELANALVRRWTRRELNRMARRHGDVVLIDGQRYRRHAAGTVRYHTLCGSVDVRRDTYRVIGIHNGPTVVPLELEAGIVENATPSLALSVVQAFAMMPLRDYEDEMRAAHRQVPSRSTLERISKRVGTSLHDELPVIEPVLRAEETAPAEAASISVGIDRTTIPMAEQQAQLPERWLRKRKRKRKRRPPPPVTVAYRMGYVATVSVNDGCGKSITSKRIAATAEQGPIEMMERLGAELERLLEQQRLPIVVVQDGAPELWNLVEEWFENFGLPIKMKLLDRYHLFERLAQVAELLERDQRGRWLLLDKWRTALDRSDTAIKRICKEIEDRVYEPMPRRRFPIGIDWPLERTPKIPTYKERAIDGHLTYCKNHRDKMRYASAREHGYPVGSGPTEGACKSVIAARLKRSGQRWFEHGASACLQLRTLYLNGRLRRAFELFGELRRREIAPS